MIREGEIPDFLEKSGIWNSDILQFIEFSYQSLDYQ